MTDEPNAPEQSTPPAARSEPNLVDSELRCPECGYNLTGLASARCPSCGWRFDVTQLVHVQSGARTRRFSAMAACAVLGIGSIAAVLSLAWPGLSALHLYDGLAIIGAIVGALGHLYLALRLGWTDQGWPLRRDESHTVLRAIGWFCLVMALVGAVPLLQVRIVDGFAVTNFFEFALVGVFYSLPGWTLLVMVMLAFRPAIPRARASRAAGAAGEGDDPAAGREVPFAVEAVDPMRIEQTWSDEPRPTTPAIEAAITRTWEAESAVTTGGSERLFNGKLVRVQASSLESGRLSLVFGPTNYRDFLGTNLYPDAAVRQASDTFLANPLGVSATIITRDKRLAFGRRSDEVAFHAGFVHTFGGMLDDGDRDASGRYDLSSSIVREVCEELGVRQAQIVDVREIALVHDVSLRQPELLFDVTITLDATELESLFSPGGGEHTHLHLIDDTPEAAIAFLSGFHQVTPIAQAALLLHGRNAWGRAWFERICRLRYGEVPPLPAIPVVPPSGTS